MVALQELFTTDVGLLSLGVLLFIVGMAVWFGRFFQARIREEVEAAKRSPSEAPTVNRRTPRLRSPMSVVNNSRSATMTSPRDESDAVAV